MAANYDNTAWFYERLSKLVFGQAQVKAQNVFLNLIKPEAHILIVGGGTGQLLESLTKLYPSGLQITYIEVSANMLTLSRKRNTGQNKVQFILGDIQTSNLSQKFEVIITAFLFDNFSDHELSATFPRVDAMLQSGGLWLNTDFQLTGPLWQKLMLRMMYGFFRLVGAVRVNKLPDAGGLFEKYKYTLIAQKSFFGHFILSCAWHKPTH
jgi:ubiquinone/menaquinone biosynthesis C-methylase UbiE